MRDGPDASDRSSKSAEADEKTPAKDDKKSDDKKSDDKTGDSKKAEKKAARDEKAILKDLDEAKEKLAAVMPSIASIGDADFASKTDRRRLPRCEALSDLLKELAAIQTDETAAAGPRG